MNKLLRFFPLAAISAGMLVGCGGGSDSTIYIYTPHESNRIELFKTELKEHFPNLNIEVKYQETGTIKSKLEADGTDISCDIIVGIEITNAEIILKNNPNVFADLSSYDTSIYVDEVLEYQQDVTLADGTVRKGHKKYHIQDKEAGCVMINTKVLEQKHLAEPESYADLLKPEYKDLIVMPNPNSSGTGYYFYNGYASVHGVEAAKTYFKALAGNVKEFSSSGSGPTRGVTSGEIAIGLGMHFQAREAANKNPDIKIKWFEEGSPYSLYTMAMINGRQEKAGVKEVYDYFYSHVNYLDNSKIVPETIYKNPLPPEVPNWVTPDKYTPMKGLLDPKYKQSLLDAWTW